jgi:hypothetical protein
LSKFLLNQALTVPLPHETPDALSNDVDLLESCTSLDETWVAVHALLDKAVLQLHTEANGHRRLCGQGKMKKEYVWIIVAADFSFSEPSFRFKSAKNSPL